MTLDRAQPDSCFEPDGDDRTIVVHFVHPPIPDRNFDWSATRYGYEPGDPIGWGKTVDVAEADLIAQEQERDDDDY